MNLAGAPDSPRKLALAGSYRRLRKHPLRKWLRTPGESSGRLWRRDPLADIPIDRIPLEQIVEATKYVETGQKGVSEAINAFEEARKRNDDSLYFSEQKLNQAGYGYLQAGKVKEAIELFKLNVLAYPDSWNTYDSLAEAYIADGNKEPAIPLSAAGIAVSTTFIPTRASRSSCGRCACRLGKQSANRSRCYRSSMETRRICRIIDGIQSIPL